MAGALADKTALSILDIGGNNIGTEGTYFFGGGRRVEWRGECGKRDGGKGLKGGVTCD